MTLFTTHSDWKTPSPPNYQGYPSQYKYRKLSFLNSSYLWDPDEYRLQPTVGATDQALVQITVQRWSIESFLQTAVKFKRVTWAPTRLQLKHKWFKAQYSFVNLPIQEAFVELCHRCGLAISQIHCKLWEGVGINKPHTRTHMHALFNTHTHTDHNWHEAET